MTYLPRIQDAGCLGLFELCLPEYILNFYGNTFNKNLFGIDRDSIRFEWMDYVRNHCHPDDQQRMLSERFELFSGNGGYTSRYRVWNRLEEKWKWQEIFGFVHPRNNSESIIIYGGARDVSDQIKLTESYEQIQEAEKRIQIMLDATPLACTFWDENLNIIDCNQESVRLYQLSSKQEYLAKFDSLFPEYQPNGRASAEYHTTQLRRALETGREVFEWLHVLPSGVQIPAEITLVRVEWLNSYRIVGYARDLREIKAADERNQIMLDATPLACIFLDKDCNYIDCNMEAVRLFGMKTKKEYLASFGRLSPEFQEDGQLSVTTISQQVLKAFNTGREVFEWTHRKADGMLFPAEVILVRVKYREGYVIAGYMRDLTEQKAHLAEIRKTHEELLLARDIAEESARTKSEFLANMSHEIRTPMNAILGMTNLVMHTELTEKQRFYIEKTQLSAKSLLRIINDILDFSKIEAGKLEFEYVEFSLQRVLSDLLDMFIDKLIEKGLFFSVQIEPDAPDALIGDSLRLNQVLLNLLGNSIKFTENGGAVLAIEQLADAGHEEEVMLRFTITDTGIGLTSEQISGLFVPFRQADSSTTRRFGGTGLGLAISRSLVEQMGGRIWCESTPGKGTSFSFTARFRTSGQEVPRCYSRLALLRVLLIGDNTTSLRFFRLQLEILRCRHIEVITFDEGPDKLRAGDMPEADLVFLDWQQPDIHCSGALEMLSLRYGSAMPRVILAISKQFSRDQLSGDISGVSGIVQKPVTLSTLHDTIGNIFYDGVPSKNPYTPVVSTDNKVAVREDIRGSRILLVEDNKINQLLAEELLVMENFTVDIASNGLEAIELLKIESYALVLMDIQMPEMDGLTATGIIRNEMGLTELPVIAMTAHAMSGDREQSLEAGMNDHITKPIDEGLLYAALNRWIRPEQE
ncbi:MAG: response regulator [Spirochaetaceae bacterium]|jgi:signal transduction histidine kinase/DNA-binding response OmpR family regulator|nr:response regulator [Spirochaetaceae bacterium]